MAFCVGVDAPDEQNDDHAQHAERLHGQAGDAAAAQGDLDGLADGARFARNVCGANICIGRAAHAEHADSAGHARAEQERDAAGHFDEQREDRRQHDHNDRDGLELCFKKCGCAGTNDPGHFDHNVCAFTHSADPEEIEQDIAEREDDQEQHNVEYHEYASVSFFTFCVFVFKLRAGFPLADAKPKSN